MLDASCRGMNGDLFFPTNGTALDDIRAVCNACRVRDECLEYALENRISHGVWGGVSERGRARLIQLRATAHATNLR